jgi:hypothetical protein
MKCKILPCKELYDFEERGNLEVTEDGMSTVNIFEN